MEIFPEKQKTTMKNTQNTSIRKQKAPKRFGKKKPIEKSQDAFRWERLAWREEF